MDDDFNTEKALAVIHEYKREIMAGLQGMTAAQRSTALRTLNSMLLDGLGIQPPEQDLIPADVAAFAAERAAARHQKNWKQADELREVIDRCGFRMQDNPDGTFTVLKKIS
jgi:cysteinyl-tRNA synthetase